MASAGGFREIWRESLISQIQKRNETQMCPYQDLILFHNCIFENWDTLKNENTQLKIQNELLRMEKGVGGGMSSVAVVASLEKKLLEQAEELAELHRNRGENANLVVSLNEKLRAMEASVEQKNERIMDLLKQESLIKQEIDGYRLLQDQMESKFQMLKDEYQALQLTSTHLEEKLRKVQSENCEMIERIKEYKSKDAEKMNEENENFIRKRNAKVQKELAEASRDTKYAQIDDGAVEGLTVYPGGGACGSGGLPNTPAIIWDAHDGEVNSVQFSPGAECLLATGGTDRKVKLWDTSRDKAELRCQLMGSNLGIMSVDFNSTGTIVLGTSADYSIKVWGVTEQRLRISLTGHSSKVLAAKFLGDQNKVVSGSHDRTIKFWDLTKCACVDAKFSKSLCNDLVVDGSARTVMSGHYDKTVKFWDTRVGLAHTDVPIHVINLGNAVTSLALSKDGKILMACVRDDTLKLIDLRTNQVIRNLESEGFVVSCEWTRAAFSADSEHAAVGSATGNVYIWNSLTGQLEQTLKQHTSAVIAVAWHPYSSNSLASVDKSKKAIYWSSI